LAGFVKGDVVVVPFPFSDLSQTKRRPALVMASLKGNDVILCQITSRKRTDSYAISIDSADFGEGDLKQRSNVRPNRIFTADANIILYKAGSLKPGKVEEIINIAVEILRG